MDGNNVSKVVLFYTQFKQDMLMMVSLEMHSYKIFISTKLR